MRSATVDNQKLIQANLLKGLMVSSQIADQIIKWVWELHSCFLICFSI